MNTNSAANQSTGLALVLACTLSIATGAANAAGGVAVDGQLDDWAALFDQAGSVRRDANGVPEFIVLHDGWDANFVWDEISEGIDLDFTALFPGDERPVDNALVAAEHDLARAYFYVEPDIGGNAVYYAGFERVLADGTTQIEIEFNQVRTRLGHGAPWEIRRIRSDDDIKVILNFVAGTLDSMVVQRAEVVDDEGTLTGWVPLVTLLAQGCNGSGAICVRSNALTIEGGGPWSDYDELNPQQQGPGEDLLPGTFLEVSINVGVLLGWNVNFASAQVSTPEDTAFGNFGEGDWGNQR